MPPHLLASRIDVTYGLLRAWSVTAHVFRRFVPGAFQHVPIVSSRVT